MLRDVDVPARVVHETHRLGLFGRQDWLDVLAGAGFVAEALDEVTTEDRAPREIPRAPPHRVGLTT